uniref:All-trans retinoic acid induced differentiation factor n=1 Tax=Chelonoidis abingdonii TaxID=106734 RepID=A0A8C0GD58_CHEAB
MTPVTWGCRRGDGETWTLRLGPAAAARAGGLAGRRGGAERGERGRAGPVVPGPCPDTAGGGWRGPVRSPPDTAWGGLAPSNPIRTLPGGAGAVRSGGAGSLIRWWPAPPLTSPVPPTPQLCSCCPGPVRNGSSVASYCAARPALELQGRCCLNNLSPGRALGLGAPCSPRVLGSPGNGVLMPWDLSVCSDLTENPLENIPNASFQGFTRLQSISLPRALECPGGSMAWDLNTTHGDSRTCQGQRNLCNTWLCPENSQCSPDGPGLVQCLCSGSYHGYKCLREGTFPLLLFYGTLGAVTTTLSLLAWGSQRRKAKAS